MCIIAEMGNEQSYTGVSQTELTETDRLNYEKEIRELKTSNDQLREVALKSLEVLSLATSRYISVKNELDALKIQLAKTGSTSDSE